MTLNSVDLSSTAQQLLDFAANNGYICPWGEAWHKLWLMLPDTTTAGGASKAANPLILGGWYSSTNLEKSLRLVEHIKWADTHDAIEEIDTYLRSLPADQWHTWKNSPYPAGC